MQVKRLLILGFKRGMDAEVMEGCKALRDRYTARGHTNVELWYTHPDLGTFTLAEPAGGDVGKGEGTGLYVVGHSVLPLVGEQKFAGIGAEPAAGIVAKFLKERDVADLRKLCLVACNAAAGKHGEKSFLENFAVALYTEGFRPKLAGWTTWVSILQPQMPLPSGRNLYVYDPETEAHRKVEKESFGEYRGRKAVNTDKRVVVSNNAARAEAKRFVWVKEDGGVTALTAEDWHDPKP
jgi:hypothetical protein